jgi:hypothetical protein
MKEQIENPKSCHVRQCFKVVFEFLQIAVFLPSNSGRYRAVQIAAFDYSSRGPITNI